MPQRIIVMHPLADHHELSAVISQSAGGESPRSSCCSRGHHIHVVAYELGRIHLKVALS